MHHKVVGNFGSEADVRNLYFRGFRFNDTSDNGACTHCRPSKKILTDFCPRYFESVPDFRPVHTKFERLLSKSVTTLEVMTYDLVVHTGPALCSCWPTLLPPLTDAVCEAAGWVLCHHQHKNECLLDNNTIYYL